MSAIGYVPLSVLAYFAE